MATSTFATTATTSNTSLSEPRPATMDRILVIEDDNALRKILHRLFSSEGYEVEVAPNGGAVLEMLRHRPFSAVIVDLPYAASSGVDLCRQIASVISGRPLVILSASLQVADKVLLLRLCDHSVQPQGTSCAFACAFASCVTSQSRKPAFLWRCDRRFVQDGDYSWRREHQGDRKGIQDA